MRYYLPLIALTLALVSCSSSGDDESSFCDDRKELQDSFQDLRDVNVVDDGIEELDSAVDAVTDDLTALRTSAAEFEPEVDALESALRDLRTAIESASTPAEKAAAAVDGLSNLSATWQTLDEAGSACD